jgi:hypothetical protein
MGFYDQRCMVTGVSLKGTDAALVLLGQTGVAHYPIALAIKGTYDRLGCIDNIEEDANTALVLAFFQARHRAGELTADLGSANVEDIDGIENLLKVFERNVTMGEDAGLLHGRRILYALVCRVVWDALAKAGPAEKGATSALFERLFADVPIAHEIYRGGLTKVARHLRELAAVNHFLAGRGLAWRAPEPESAEQHYDEEMRQFLAEARGTFHGAPVVLRALDDYEGEVADLLEES